MIDGDMIDKRDTLSLPWTFRCSPAAVASTILDVSPFATNGAIMVANAKVADKDVFFRQRLIYPTVVAPVVVWLRRPATDPWVDPSPEQGEARARRTAAPEVARTRQ